MRGLKKEMSEDTYTEHKVALKKRIHIAALCYVFLNGPSMPDAALLPQVWVLYYQAIG